MMYWKDTADWSAMPDVYVTRAQVSDGMFWRIEACSVPMAIGPEVRLVRADLSTYAAGMRAMREAAADEALAEGWGDGDRDVPSRIEAASMDCAERIATAIRAIPVPEDDPVTELMRAAKKMHLEAYGWGVSQEAIDTLGAALAKMEGRG